MIVIAKEEHLYTVSLSLDKSHINSNDGKFLDLKNQIPLLKEWRTTQRPTHALVVSNKCDNSPQSISL